MSTQIDDLMRVFGLQRFGELAELAGVTPAAICRWRERGVSARVRWRLHHVAQERGIELPQSVVAPCHETAAQVLTPADEAA